MTRLNAPPEQSDRTGDADSDSTFNELLGEIARAPHADLLPRGAHVGEYEVLGMLGRGTFGVVYQATHRVIGKQAALKVLNALFANDPSIVARFVDEARAVNRIAHPNIVDIFGFGSLEDGRKYCVMELLQGETLGSCLERRGRLPLAEAVPILTQIAAALDAAHTSGIVHRDLKPDNVFLLQVAPSSSVSEVAASLKVKLLDFGIAQIADGLHQRTGSQVTLGTPAYMSPEQCEGGRVDHRSDIYALGLVAFRMLTGHLPFSGSNGVQMALKHVSAAAPAPSTEAPELPGSVDSAVLRMLAKRADERPASASAAILAMRDESQATTAAVLVPRRALGKPKRGRVALAATGFLSLCLGGYLLRGVATNGDSRASAEHPAAFEPASIATQPAAGKATTAPALSSAESRTVDAAPNISLRLEGQPASAKVFVGAREVGHIGQNIELPSSDSTLVLTVRAPGYVGRDLRLVPNRDQVVQVQLSRAKTRSNADLEY